MNINSSYQAWAVNEADVQTASDPAIKHDRDARRGTKPGNNFPPVSLA